MIDPDDQVYITTFKIYIYILIREILIHYKFALIVVIVVWYNFEYRARSFSRINIWHEIIEIMQRYSLFM